MLISRIGLVRMPRFCCASMRSSSRLGPWPPATRQEALLGEARRGLDVADPLAERVLDRRDGRGLVGGRLVLLRRVRLVERGIRPKSRSPWLSDFSGLPSNSIGIEVQNASTGSVSSSTSMPRAVAASSFGLDFSRSMLSPTR